MLLKMMEKALTADDHMLTQSGHIFQVWATMSHPGRLHCRCASKERAHKVLARPIEDGLPNVAAPCRHTHIEVGQEILTMLDQLPGIERDSARMGKTKEAQQSALTVGALQLSHDLQTAAWPA